MKRVAIQEVGTLYGCGGSNWMVLRTALCGGTSQFVARLPCFK